jgi:predicted transposase YbfD/YdcC
MHRQITHKSTAEIVEETDYAITCLDQTAKPLYTLWRGHWQVENRLHHKRDTVFGEDASRSRKGAAGLMYFRDVLLNLLHLENIPVLRAIRHFSAHSNDLLALIRAS